MYTMEEYGNYWAVYEPNGKLLCVCVYKKGALCLVAHLNEMMKSLIGGQHEQ